MKAKLLALIPLLLLAACAQGDPVADTPLLPTSTAVPVPTAFTPSIPTPHPILGADFTLLITVEISPLLPLLQGNTGPVSVKMEAGGSKLFTLIVQSQSYEPASYRVSGFTVPEDVGKIAVAALDGLDCHVIDPGERRELIVRVTSEVSTVEGFHPFAIFVSRC